MIYFIVCKRKTPNLHALLRPDPYHSTAASTYILANGALFPLVYAFCLATCANNIKQARNQSIWIAATFFFQKSSATFICTANVPCACASVTTVFIYYQCIIVDSWPNCQIAFKYCETDNGNVPYTIYRNSPSATFTNFMLKYCIGHKWYINIQQLPKNR